MKPPKEWFIDWFYNRYQWDRHVPMSMYLLVQVFHEALKDYDRELREEIARGTIEGGNLGVDSGASQG